MPRGISTLSKRQKAQETNRRNSKLELTFEIPKIYSIYLYRWLNNFPNSKTGPKGERGDFGFQGETGRKGEIGDQGLPGRHGERGDFGLQGEIGLDGSPGT